MSKAKLVSKIMPKLLKKLGGELKDSAKKFSGVFEEKEMPEITEELLNQVNAKGVERAYSRIVEEPIAAKVGIAAKRVSESLSRSFSDPDKIKKSFSKLRSRGFDLLEAEELYDGGANVDDVLRAVKKTARNKFANEMHDKVNAEIAAEVSHFMTPERAAKLIKKSVKASAVETSDIGKALKSVDDIEAALKDGNIEGINAVLKRMPVEVKGELSKNLYRDLVTVKKVALKSITLDDLKPGAFQKYTSTMEDTVHMVGSYASANGHKALENHMENMYSFLRSRQSVHSKMSRVGAELITAFETEPEKARHIGAYIENINKYGKILANSDSRFAVEANDELADLLKLNDNDVRLANKTINFFRQSKLNEKLITERQYTRQKFFQDLDDIPDYTIMNKENLSNSFQSDYGYDYIPHVIKKEVREDFARKAREEGFELDSSFDEFYDATPLLKKSRSLTADISGIDIAEDGTAIIKDSMRMPRHEEIQRYIRDYTRIADASHMKELALQAKASTMESALSVTKRMEGGDYKAFNNNVVQAIDGLMEHFKAANRYTPQSENKAFRALSEFVNFQTSAALINPSLLFFNMNQALTNSTTFKSLNSVGMSTIKQMGPFAKANARALGRTIKSGGIEHAASKYYNEAVRGILEGQDKNSRAVMDVIEADISAFSNV